MSKPIVLSLVVTVLIGASVYSADTAKKLKMSEIAPAEDLVAAVDAKIVALEKYVGDAATFKKSGEKLTRDAGMLAVLAQAIVEHDQPSAWQKSAADVREAAMKLAAVESQGEATQLLQAVKDAKAGKLKGADAKADWDSLTDFDSLMSEVKMLNRNVGKAARKMRRGLDEEARNAAARDAEVLAIIGLVIEADTNYLEEDSGIPKWKQYSVDQRTTGTELAAAFRANDAGGVKAAYSKFRKSCSGCHKEFRD